MIFEWDPLKDQSNRKKHALDFESSKTIWEDPDRIEIVAPYPLENRVILIGAVKSQLWTAVYTWRRGAIRIISVRRSRKKEKELYEKEKHGQR
ncbi:MAG: BrnT family toxin [Deltaproteobacteria bacterium]|nr:BrnT family toxin [Deltaproteobacteria bacterium]